MRQFEMTVQGQAVMLASDKLFVTHSVLMAVAACSIWLTAKPGAPVAASSAH